MTVQNILDQLFIFEKLKTHALLSTLVLSVKKEYSIDLNIPPNSTVHEIIKLIMGIINGQIVKKKINKMDIKEDKFCLGVEDLNNLSHELIDYFKEKSIIKDDKINLTNIDELIASINGREHNHQESTKSNSGSDSESDSDQESESYSGSDSDSDLDSESDSNSDSDSDSDSEYKVPIEQELEQEPELENDQDDIGSGSDVDSDSVYSD